MGQSLRSSIISNQRHKKHRHVQVTDSLSEPRFIAAQAGHLRTAPGAVPLMAAPIPEKALSRAQRRRRADIIDAALRVFDQQGFEVARMEDVAAEAEIAKGTVYLYFENKQALLERVIRAVLKPALDAVEEAAADDSQSASQRLVRQVRAMGYRLGKGPMKTVLRLMIAEGPRHDELRQFYYREVVRP